MPAHQNDHASPSLDLPQAVQAVPPPQVTQPAGNAAAQDDMTAADVADEDGSWFDAVCDTLPEIDVGALEECLDDWSVADLWGDSEEAAPGEQTPVGEAVANGDPLSQTFKVARNFKVSGYEIDIRFDFDIHISPSFSVDAKTCEIKVKPPQDDIWEIFLDGVVQDFPQVTPLLQMGPDGFEAGGVEGTWAGLTVGLAYNHKDGAVDFTAGVDIFEVMFPAVVESLGKLEEATGQKIELKCGVTHLFQVLAGPSVRLEKQVFSAEASAGARHDENLKGDKDGQWGASSGVAVELASDYGTNGWEDPTEVKGSARAWVEVVMAGRKFTYEVGVDEASKMTWLERNASHVWVMQNAAEVALIEAKDDLLAGGEQEHRISDIVKAVNARAREAYDLGVAQLEAQHGVEMGRPLANHDLYEYALDMGVGKGSVNHWDYVREALDNEEARVTHEAIVWDTGAEDEIALAGRWEDAEGNALQIAAGDQDAVYVLPAARSRGVLSRSGQLVSGQLDSGHTFELQLQEGGDRMSGWLYGDSQQARWILERA